MSRLYKNISFFILASALFSCRQDKKENATYSPETATEKVTVSDVEKGIRANIEKQTNEDDGYFHFTNDTSEFSLKLVRVHTEYLSVLGPHEFFACVDLATEEGDVYDVDFFLNGTKDDMKVTKTTLHKLNGKPYYTWEQAEDKTWFTVPIEDASNKLLGIVEGQDNFTFTYQIDLPEIENSAQIWIPIATSNQFQTIDLQLVKTSIKYNMIQDNDYGNAILYAQLEPENSHQQFTINYKVKRLEKAPYEEEDPDLLKYLQPSALMPIGDRFSTIAEEVIEKRHAETPLTKARALYDYVIDNVRYAKQGTYGTGNSNYACDSKSGNCTEFHSLFISLARSAGIPARFAVGAAIPSSRDEGGVDGYHCWAEFYAEGKWWPVDISEADKYTALATYYFGHHPANRIEFSKGRDIKPEPMPALGPINFLAYPVLEINGEPEKVETTFTFHRTNKGS